MEQYFNPNPNLPHQLRSFTEELNGERFIFLSDSGTFSRNRLDFGTRLMLEAGLSVQDFPAQGKILDLACGWGPVGTVVKRFFPEAELTMSDVNVRALALAEKNVVSNNPGAEARVLEADGIAGIEDHFDLIFLNPPIRAGKSTVYRLFKEACLALNEGGRLLCVIQKKQGADSAKKELQRLFGQNEVRDLSRRAGFHVFMGTAKKREKEALL